MQSQNTLAARTVLLRYMEFRSEERWAASWRGDLEYALTSLDDRREIGAFRWLVEQAGGWWSWAPGDVMREFTEGSYVELQKRALAAGWASDSIQPARTAAAVDDLVTDAEGKTVSPDPSWEAVARRLWSVRYKAAQFLAIVIGLNAISAWQNWDENTTLLIGAPVAVLVLVPDPPLWRMPLRSRQPEPESTEDQNTPSSRP